MAAFWKLVWRNVLRHRRRSLLTCASIGLGLAAVMFGQSLMKSIQRQMILKSTGVMFGHLQIQVPGARDPKVPDKLLGNSRRYLDLLAKDARVEAASTRLLFTGLVYSAAASRGLLICGVEPEQEKRLSIIPNYLTQGRYLGESPRDIFIGDKLADELDTYVGEKLVVLAQSKSGELNSELFRVAGLFHSGSLSFDAQIAYVPISMAQKLRGAEGQVSYVVVRLTDVDLSLEAAQEWTERLKDFGVRVLSYEDIALEIVGVQKFEDAIMIVALIIIFSIVGLGIWNTISMSFFERIREFGLLRAIGARPALVFKLLVAESALMGLLGIVSGLILGGWLIAYFGRYGLDLTLKEAMSYFIPFEAVIYLHPVWRLHLWAVFGSFTVCILASLGPALRGARLAVAKALQHI
ncbi:MAG: hypothetical protein A3G41_08350 [Elusimicrobia bacterium RIFCSPLOWO2_12_FULL_59_9]|nr:MAG: hypothetical protein A3G41_08350 [Elusimicrobia bacterium RIFCSPLOWO2_12_FULL_59_9]